MRRKLTVLLGSILFLALAAPLFGQSKSIIVDVPFSFTVSQQVYPAGKYVVSACDPGTYPNMYRLSTLDGKSTTMFGTSSVQSPNAIHAPSLLFANLGTEHALFQIWTGSQWGSELSTANFKNRVIAKAQKVRVVAQR
jgi:hypothetical protein